MPDSPRRDARGGEPDAHPPQPAQPPLQQPAQPPRQPVGSQPASAQIDAGWSADRGQRLWLWIDAVGGYLVCRGTSVTLGAPSGHGEVDVPILGDVSRRHARIRRDEEGYVIEAAGSVSINGRPVASAAALVDGDQIDLGGGVRLAFTRPHALSGSARLDFVSRHRTQPPADAVLLMADSLVLGPGPTTHVRCPDWSADVVLFGAGDALACRAVGEFQIDGEPCTSRGQLHGQAHVTGEDFSFSLEAM